MTASTRNYRIHSESLHPSSTKFARPFGVVASTRVLVCIQSFHPTSTKSSRTHSKPHHPLKSSCIHSVSASIIHSLRPIAHWRRFKIRRQASTPGDSAGRATDTRYQRLYSNNSNTRTQQFSARCSIYGTASTREDKAPKWLQTASSPIKTIIWCCFAAGVDAVMLRSKENANKRRRMVWS